MLFSRSFCIWRSVSGAEAVIRWARACASVALCPDGLALARWLRCVPIGSRLRMGCAAFLPLQHSWQQGNYNQRFKTLGAFRAVGSKRSTAPTPASPVGKMGSRLCVGCAVFRWARACALAALPAFLYYIRCRGEVITNDSTRLERLEQLVLHAPVPRIL